MRKRALLTLALVAATAMLSLATSTASATRVEIQESARGFKIVWSSLEFIAMGAGTARCPVTLEGSFHRSTYTKVSGSLIGYVTEVFTPGTEPPCVGGIAAALHETLPWHVRYDSFQGTLPAITEIRLQIIGAAFRISIGEITCLALSTAQRPVYGRTHLTEAGGGVRRIAEITAEGTISLTGGVACALVTGRIAGTTSAVTYATIANPIRVLLI